MKKLFLFLFSALLISGSVFASPEPELVPSDKHVVLPPAIEPEFPPMTGQNIQPDIQIDKPLTLQEKCNALQSLSSAPYYTFMRDLGCSSG